MRQPIGLPCTTRPVPVFGKQQFVAISTGFRKSHVRGDDARQSVLLGTQGVSGQLAGDGTANVAVSLPILGVKEPAAP